MKEGIKNTSNSRTGLKNKKPNMQTKTKLNAAELKHNGNIVLWSELLNIKIIFNIVIINYEKLWHSQNKITLQGN